MGRNAVENEQQQIDDLIIMIYFSFDHVDTTNLYGTNGLVLVQIKDTFPKNNEDSYWNHSLRC
ncbi:hypothetical protein LW858_33290 (plasmid) [Bacillus cereus]|uniref:hypothetical protein n=1 Tax=Bacillus cereus TaxID=1396 RepID=UPI001F23B390|nr:hypothetical protein [Bacillus cereus]UIJ70177.1 hypothetical protein LW858_33290 [Bacillus cereus]